jgi:broad specificity phosphatase PhoE
MKIYIVRHGQTEYNVKDLCDSDPSVNVQLTEKGVRQAETAALNLKDADFEAIYTSEFLRTKETSLIINGFHKKKIFVDPRLDDRMSGFQDRPAEQYYSFLEKSDDMWNAKHGDGESFEEMKIRVQSFLDDLSKKDYGSVLIVGHMEIVQALIGLIKGMTNIEMWNNHVDNCQIFELEI